MVRDSMFRSAFMTAGVLAVFLVGCAPPANEAQEAARAERLASLETTVAQLETAIAENQVKLLDETRKIKASLRTMIGRGLIVAPETVKKPPKIGELTNVTIGRAPTLGPEDAEVEVVEFGEFQCPYCMKQENLLRELVAEYPGKVRVAFRHYPLGRRHSQAVTAAKASWAAQQQGKFWEMHDALFASRGKLPDEVILGHAEAIGLDMERFKRDWESQEAVNSVYRDRRAGKESGLRGTPTFYVNGRLVGGRPQGVRKAIERELRLREEGVLAGPASDVGAPPQGGS